ncbi:hypothetical protein IQ216_00185 [Cyanobium sp. LEGE 06143]|uniref:hypothetical protein n=1 Tax=Cyanobium sp. LEGE 06143 TaxID=945727 RepID=UPI00187EC0ED|nr:hypothetical protein [Cyanobium sp. LEGE 06143]MBE9171563.1 hypothetical protein [Cyanobium sp. LEGE 06143]
MGFRPTFLPLTLWLLIAISACSAGRQEADQAGLTGETSRDMPATPLIKKDIEVCSTEQTSYLDIDDNDRLSVGDTLIYTIALSTNKNCSSPDGTFYGKEELIQDLGQGQNGDFLWLTSFQGHLVLPDGTVQARSLGQVEISAQQVQAISAAAPGPVEATIEDLLPVAFTSSLLGTDKAYGGTVGTMSFDDADRDILQIELFQRP